ncbi:equilibrative nucleoside transporter 1 [Anaeramoeba flamelloides]|uniref:Equilibrative nucleoside transporter 1 n=1 Tax=Anaeramoeba flamelloides TaxID=1746091 RepID=A0ABQ8YL21_9EUKA|nr:equilibrative nucleoside transporter 1 [Anaeramoeba flamelloides]
MHNQQKTIQHSSLFYFYFIFLGIAHLLPYHSIIVAYDYFENTLGKRSKNFEFYFVTTFNLTTIPPFLVAFIYATKNTKQKAGKGNFFSNPLTRHTIRIVPSLIFYVLVVISIPIITSKIHSERAFIILVIEIGFVGVATGIVEFGIYGLASIANPKYIVAIVTGQGVSGVLLSIIRMITKATGNTPINGVKSSGFLFFFSCGFIILLVLIGYLFLIRSKFMKFNIDRYTRNVLESKLLNIEPLGNIMMGQTSDNEKRNLLSINKSQGNYKNDIVIESGSGSESDSESGDVKEMKGEKVLLLQTKNQQSRLKSIWKIFIKLLKMEISIFLIFLISLAIFPSIAVRIPSTNPKLNKSGWFPLILIFVFDLSDLIGRTLPKWFNNFISNNLLFWVIFSRSIFIVLYILMVKKIIFNEFITFICIFLTSLTDGYCSCLVLMRAPNLPSIKPEEKNIASLLMALFLQLGLFFGSCLSWLLLPLIEK